MKNVFLFLSALVLGVILMIALYLLNDFKNKPQLVGKPSNFSIKIPPSRSINGKITSFSQGIMWQERDATQASELKSKRPAQQGERIVTDDKGEIVIEFDKILTLKISQNTDLMIVQTLPENFVFMQTQGLARYERIGDIPVSIRALHLLIDQEPGSISVDVVQEDKIVSIDILRGKITLAFNDLDFRSKLFTAGEGQKLIFDDAKREVEINDF